jgi:hypothetical protein
MFIPCTHLQRERLPSPRHSLGFGETCTKAGELRLQRDCEEFDSPSLHHISVCPCSSVIERSPCKREVASLILRQGLHGAIFYELGKPVFTRLKRVRVSLALPRTCNLVEKYPPLKRQTVGSNPTTSTMPPHHNRRGCVI